MSLDKIERVRKHVAALEERARSAREHGRADVLTEAFEDLRTTLEELQAAEEELVRQNMQLVAASQELEAERAR